MKNEIKKKELILFTGLTILAFLSLSFTPVLASSDLIYWDKRIVFSFSDRFLKFDDWVYFESFDIGDTYLIFQNLQLNTFYPLIEIGLDVSSGNCTILESGDYHLYLNGEIGYSGFFNLTVDCFSYGEPVSVEGATAWDYSEPDNCISLYVSSNHYIYITWQGGGGGNIFVNLPLLLSLRMGGSVFANGLLLTLLAVLCFTLPCIVYVKSKTLPVIVAFIVMVFCVYVEWLNFWFLIVIGLLFVLLYWKVLS